MLGNQQLQNTGVSNSQCNCIQKLNKYMTPTRHYNHICINSQGQVCRDRLCLDKVLPDYEEIKYRPKNFFLRSVFETQNAVDAFVMNMTHIVGISKCWLTMTSMIGTCQNAWLSPSLILAPHTLPIPRLCPTPTYPAALFHLWCSQRS